MTSLNIDAARLTLALNELRLPAIKTLWPRFAEQADKEGWCAAHLLSVLAVLTKCSEAVWLRAKKPSLTSPNRRHRTARQQQQTKMMMMMKNTIHPNGNRTITTMKN